MVKIKANISCKLLRRHIHWRDQLIEELRAFISCWWPWWASALFAVSASVWRRFVGPNFLAIFLGYDSAQLDFCFPRNKSNSSRFPNRQNRNEAPRLSLKSRFWVVSDDMLAIESCASCVVTDEATLKLSKVYWHILHCWSDEAT